MPEQNVTELPELHAFDPLGKYPLGKRLLIYAIDYSLYIAIRILGKTIQYEFQGWTGSDIENWESYEIAAKRSPASINVFWHNRLFLATHYGRTHRSASHSSIMISKSFDGEYISRIAQRFGYGVIRGSSTRGGSEGLKKMVRHLKSGHTMAFTIDGPLGPRYEVKPGVLLLAQKTGVPIVPFSIEAKKFWTVNSWDKLQIPKPFTRARVFLGEPIFIPMDAGKEEIGNQRRILQRKLDELVFIGKQWRISKD